MNNLAIQFIIQIVTFGVFAVGMIMGSEVSEQGNITKGRNEGIILCSEKPEQCKIEYNYLKLKATQK